MVPALMVFSCLLWSIAALWIGIPLLIALPFFIYAIAAILVGIQLSKKQKSDPRLVALAISICHWCYGVGFWRGVFRIVTLRKFDTKPKGGRR